MMADTTSQLSVEDTSSDSSNVQNNSAESISASAHESSQPNSRSEEMIEPVGLDESCQNMFKKISEYLQCELNSRY